MNFSYKDSCLLDDNQVEKTAKGLENYLNHLNLVAEADNYNFDESSINLPADQKILDQVLSLRQKKATPELKYVINVGIGGSTQGAKAVYDSIFGYLSILEPDRFPKLISIDTSDPEVLNKFSKFFEDNIAEANQFMVVFNSKSGLTTETVFNMEYILSLVKKIPEFKDRIVVTSDKNSKLSGLANQYGFDTLTLPEKVGDRFSVFSEENLFPLSLLGVDIQRLVAGALQARQVCLTNDLGNPALISAVVLYLQNLEGKNICDTFFFHPELESIGKWYRQLMGESIGKEKDLKGKKVNAGITPTTSIGSNDLHSVLQLNLGGPKDKITTFVYTLPQTGPMLQPELELPGLVENIEGKGAGDIMKAILEGVKISYKSSGLPFLEIVLEDLSEYSLGQFLQFKMIEMMLLGKLLNVNTFDQPNVESYKKETKKILSGS